MFRMKKQEYKEQERHYYFFDYLFWLGEITWEHYHKVSFKQPRGSDMLWACITFFIFMPVLTMNVRGIFFLLGVPVGRSGFTFQVLA